MSAVSVCVTTSPSLSHPTSPPPPSEPSRARPLLAGAFANRRSLSAFQTLHPHSPTMVRSKFKDEHPFGRSSPPPAGVPSPFGTPPPSRPTTVADHDLHPFPRFQRSDRLRLNGSVQSTATGESVELLSPSALPPHPSSRYRRPPLACLPLLLSHRIPGQSSSFALPSIWTGEEDPNVSV